MRRVVRLLALFTVAVTMLPFLDPAVAQGRDPQAPDRPLRAMTYNIKHGQSNAPCTQPARIPGQPPFPDCNLDIEGTIAVLRAHDADVIALQEVDRFWARSAYLDEPAVIAAALEMDHYCFGANLDHAPDSHSNVPHQYGTAIISRFPILSCANTPLTTFAGWEQRGILGALVNVRGVPTHVYSTHLQASRTVGGVVQSATPQRVLQVQDIMELLSGVTDPIVLMGDFNAGSTSSEMRPLYTRFIDVWRAAGVGSGNTSPARLTGNPTSRIDYIFVSTDVAITSVYVPIDAQTRRASDHYPVVSSLAVPGSQVGIRRHVPTMPDPAVEGESEEYVEDEPGGGGDGKG
jgi:endonuclease/exonuclease/phosphatase family metal-dependent hydrolase